MNEQTPFEFVPGPQPSSLRIIFRGFWQEEQLEAYRAALAERARHAATRPAVTRVLIDLRECAVQSQQVIDGIAVIIASYASKIQQFGLALPPSSLLRIQMKRLMSSTATTIIPNGAEADWLRGAIDVHTARQDPM